MNQAICITVICNEEELRHSLIALLRAYDFGVLEYSSVDHCIEKTISKTDNIANTEIAVIDLNLAREDELNSLRHLRHRIPRLRSVLAIAPNVDGRLGLKAKAAGADYLVERPYMPLSLIMTVSRLAGLPHSDRHGHYNLHA